RFVSYGKAARTDLRPCPTRRSSDLDRRGGGRDSPGGAGYSARFRRLGAVRDEAVSQQCHHSRADPARLMRWAVRGRHWTSGGQRSEEHTSELQSRENLVCRLLLEKK